LKNKAFLNKKGGYAKAVRLFICDNYSMLANILILKEWHNKTTGPISVGLNAMRFVCK
jgi:hypothetical protein